MSEAPGEEQGRGRSNNSSQKVHGSSRFTLGWCERWELFSRAERDAPLRGGGTEETESSKDEGEMTSWSTRRRRRPCAVFRMCQMCHLPHFLFVILCLTPITSPSSLHTLGLDLISSEQQSEGSSSSPPHDDLRTICSK